VSLALLELHPERGREHRFPASAVIGRDGSCDLVLADPLISRRHARVFSSPLGAAIQDLDSANGLYVNGSVANGVTPLHPGDVIQLGGTWWRVTEVSPGA
jgi:pSer/pThr/pTyr-binding forkhead associated (FHA) protein